MRAGCVTAPGKAVIIGEYAVLRGASAVVMAIDRRARVCIEPPRADRCSVVTPGYAEGKWAFDIAGGKPVWVDGQGPPIVDAVFRVLPRPPSDPVDLSIDTLAFVDSGSGDKLGLGSSAAATTALVAAFSDADGDDLRQLVAAAHRALQGGVGSGIDVAASCEGGLISFTREGGVQGRLDWPAGLHYRFFFSGRPASTGAAISRTAGIPASDDAWRDLVARANETALVIETGDAGAAQAAIRTYSDALRRFDEAHEVGIFEAGHDTLRQRSEEAGVVYKPCGAGGGDIGIAVATDRDRLDAFAAIAVDTGFVPLGLQMDNTGVTRETTALQ